LEQNQPITLLPDHKAETLEAWLKAHPGIEILSRDRSKAYKLGMTQGSPDAIQVADRFHLLQNLEGSLEKLFKGHTQTLQIVEKTHQTRKIASLQPLEMVEVELPEDTQSQKSVNRTLRLEKYEQTHKLRQQGYSIKDTAHHLGIGKRTAYTYLSAETFPERQPTIRQRGSGLEPYKPYLKQRWSLGYQQTKALSREIQQQGYRGSYPTLACFTQQLPQLQSPSKPAPESLNHLPGRGAAPKIETATQKPLSARRTAWLILQYKETLTSDEDKLMTYLAQQPNLSGVITLAQDFIHMVRQRLPSLLDTWLETAKNTSIKIFQSFAQGLQDDYDAVKAGLTLDVSNRPVERHNNRLKMLKRQMFGRAGLDLLAKRVILTS